MYFKLYFLDFIMPMIYGVDISITIGLNVTKVCVGWLSLKVLHKLQYVLLVFKVIGTAAQGTTGHHLNYVIV